MKLKITAIILFVSLSCSLNVDENFISTTDDNTAEITLDENSGDRAIGAITIASVGKLVLDAAKEAIGSKVKGFLITKIKGILGINTEAEVVPVDLSAKALAEIRKIVANEIKTALNEYWFNSSHQEAQQLLRDIKSLYDRYIAEELKANPLSSNILWQLYYKCNELNEFTVFTGTGLSGKQVDKYWLTINTYALLVVLRYPILLEMQAKNLFLSKEQTVRDVKVMYNRLNEMQKAMYRYIYKNVYITNSIYPDYTYSVDRVYDNIGRKNYVYFGPYQGGYSQAACARRDSLVSKYVNQFGNYSKLLFTLKDLTNINLYTSTDLK